MQSTSTSRNEKADAPTSAFFNSQSTSGHIFGQSGYQCKSFAEARRLHTYGLKLCELHRNSKRPVGDGWNNHAVSSVRQDAGGYGLMLAMNGMCSVDVDNEALCLEGLARCGFDLEKIRGLGVHTSSTRPGSGGRVTFKVPVAAGLRWLKFSSKTHGTILELRAESPNLQDTLPGTVYNSADGSGPWVQDYDAGGLWTLDCAPELPADMLAWWQRMSTDVDYLREQQALLVGQDVHLAISSGGGSLAFTSPYRVPYNAEHRVAEILERHDYTLTRNGRYAPKTATGAAAVRAIPGRDDLWQSDHASDPLFGTFDAWTAHVVLDCGGDLLRAESEAETSREIAATDGFEEVEQVSTVLPVFTKAQNGRVKSSKTNLIKALRAPAACGFSIRFDTFRGEILLAEQGETECRPLREEDYTQIALNLERWDFGDLSKDARREGVQFVAAENKFDSAQDWLNRLQWDGVPRVETFSQAYLGASDTPYHRAVSRYMWTAMAGRVLLPGCKADMAPVFVGEQGCGKTTAVEAICPNKEHFVTVDLAAGDAESARLMRNKLVCELGEMKGLSHKDVEHVKAFISKTVDEWTPKYQELTTTYPRRSIFIGTSNRHDFLADVTGARRWLPFDVGQCRPELIARDRDQLWAEGAAIFKEQGIAYAEAERLARGEHGRFEDSDEWEPLVAAYLHGGDLFADEKLRFVTGGQVLLSVGVQPAQQTKPLQTRVRNILLKLKCDPANKWIDGVRTRGYVVPEMEQ